MAVEISGVEKFSIAEKVGIKSLDKLISLNNNEIFDILDYRFHEVNNKLKIVVSRKGHELTFNVNKPEYDSLGLVFESYLMDEQKHCKNNCIFCFIDQLPKGLRDTLYFKDDDSRLSFLLGNYITLTNLSERDIQRIIEMHLSPINISVHTTDPELRCKMMNNRFAGNVLDIMKRFHEANIKMNCQIVLCPSINDSDKLKNTLEDLAKLYPSVQSIAVVPVGLTKFREGLYPLRCFSESEALDTLNIIHDLGDELKQNLGTRLIFPSDEFYLKAKRPIPPVDFFEELSQLENGVGMSALFKDEFEMAFDEFEEKTYNRNISIATGVAAFPLISSLLDKAKEKYKIKAEVFEIKNNFLGNDITVSGLICGNDLINSLKGKQLGSELLIPANMLRSERDMFLDSITLEEVEKSLSVKVKVCSTDGYEFLEKILDVQR